MSNETAFAVTVAIGDAGAPSVADVPLDELRRTLARLTHEQALQRFGIGACRYSVFEPDERVEFDRVLAELGVPGDDRITHLQQWDACDKPLACVHAQTREPDLSKTFAAASQRASDSIEQLGAAIIEAAQPALDRFAFATQRLLVDYLLTLPWWHNVRARWSLRRVKPWDKQP